MGIEMKENVQRALNAASESILSSFSNHQQIVKTCEELGELTTVLCKKLNGSPTTHEAVCDEIADVFIMIVQMRLIFGAATVDDRILYKLNRTMEFIRNRNKGAIQSQPQMDARL